MRNERQGYGRVPRYTISVAARLAGTMPHTLRAYEEAGLIEPARTDSGNRLYSDEDIDRLRHIQSIAERGVNYAGIRIILEMEGRRGGR